MLMLGRVRVQPVGSDGLKLLIFIAPRAHDRTHASYELVASRMLIIAAATTLSRLDHDGVKR
jgi:hypothetical protein